jgi:type VI secretion system protein ImpA
MAAAEQRALDASELAALADEQLFSSFLVPISEQSPCGQDLEDSSDISELQGLGGFGFGTVAPDKCDWRELKAVSVKALSRSKDIRVLIWFAASALWTDRLHVFLSCISVAARWLEMYWNDLYPKVDGDGGARRNGLVWLTDATTIIHRLRRTALLRHSQLGSLSLRDVDMAEGRDVAGTNDKQRTLAEIEAHIVTADISEVNATLAAIAIAQRSLNAISKSFANNGLGQLPAFDALLDVLNQITSVLKRHPGIDTLVAGDAVSPTRNTGCSTMDVRSQPAALAQADQPSQGIRSREDAVRMLKQVTAYFRQHEPSSPVPLFLERVCNLIGRDFLEILKDLGSTAEPVLRVNRDT